MFNYMVTEIFQQVMQGHIDNIGVDGWAGANNPPLSHTRSIQTVFPQFSTQYRREFGQTHQMTIFSRVLRDSTTRFVGPSVGPSVRPSVGPSVRPSVTLYFFWFFAVYGLTAPAQVIK